MVFRKGKLRLLGFAGLQSERLRERFYDFSSTMITYKQELTSSLAYYKNSTVSMIQKHNNVCNTQGDPYKQSCS